MAFLETLFVAATVMTSSSQRPINLESIPNFIYAPLVRQGTDYTCGVAATQSVLHYYGDEYREDQLIKVLKPSPKDGTLTKNIISFVKSEGFKVDAKENMSVEMLEENIDAGHPVIVLLQAWPEQPVDDWSKDWDDGHFAVVTGYDDDNLFFMDPSSTGNYTYIPKGQFVERWHDIDGKTRLEKYGLVIYKERSTFNFHEVIPLE